MGLGGISIWQLLIVLLIVVLLFGTKKLKGLGNDLGDAVKGFRKAVTDDQDKDAKDESAKQSSAEQGENESSTKSDKPS